ncbi:hypothetical protein NKOR_06195 [Candidatus Nitrosopumilus koreensis AR1]|uniref:Protein-disulfide isomerase n=1 Tax=Candidatus Nitrosopumilus koreensis AR1 TaxID=1229908 RepID=K0B827_9ARCH|nr:MULTISPECIES: hypothetical protein [Nitrosopumilus]AFS81120.1 hypothetical protein NKOR_06195 [Candidatus Nitrosopumilus koreensis AR1]
MKTRFLIIIGIIVVMVIIIGVLLLMIKNNQESESLFAPPIINKVHQHAGILFMIHGEKFDLNDPQYQQVSYWINFQSPYDDVIHIHGDRVTVGYLFETLNFKLDEKCIAITNGTSYCTDERYSLKYFVNDNMIDDVSDYDVSDGDRILISYGNETRAEIEHQITMLNEKDVTVDMEHLLGKQN